MSLFKSWLQSPSQHSRNLPNSTTTTSHPTVTASTIRLPPSASPRLSSTRIINRGDDSTEQYFALRRQEKGLQHDLQRLLDAQASALVAGGSQDDVTSDGGSESTIRSNQNKVVPVRQPEQRPVGLRSARRGITQAMRQLSSIKSEEQNYLHARIQEGKVAREKAEVWEKMKADLSVKMSSIQESQRGQRADELKEQSSALEEQIQEIELQLMELRSQHRAVNLELGRLDNAVQAKISSYKGALTQLDSEIYQFLAQPPLPPIEQPQEDSYLRLPKKRRTLGMALEYLQHEEVAAEELLKTTDAEQEALEDGIVMWRDLVRDITAFETLLSSELKDLKSDVASPQGADRGQGMENVLSRLDETIQQVQRKLETAQLNGWKLLVCCIGAELEALQQGKTILVQTSTKLQGSGTTSSQIESSDISSTSTVRSAGLLDRQSSGDSDESKPEGLLVDHGAEDDEPDPDLLVSQDDRYVD